MLCQKRFRKILKLSISRFFLPAYLKYLHLQASKSLLISSRQYTKVLQILNGYIPFIHYLFLFMDLIIITIYILTQNIMLLLGLRKMEIKLYLWIKLKIVRKSNINIYICNTGQIYEVKLILGRNKDFSSEP